MGLLKGESVYAFSGFSGQLLFKGEPASNAKITRRYELSKPNEYEDSTITDSEGRFSFESAIADYRKPLLDVHGFLARQQIFVEYQRETYQIWGGSKDAKEEYSEFKGKPQNLTCELTEEPHMVDLRTSFIGTSCHWDVD